MRAATTWTRSERSHSLRGKPARSGAESSGIRTGGSRLFEIVIATKWMTDWRVQRVCHPYGLLDRPAEPVIAGRARRSIVGRCGWTIDLKTLDSQLCLRVSQERLGGNRIEPQRVCRFREMDNDDLFCVVIVEGHGWFRVTRARSRAGRRRAPVDRRRDGRPVDDAIEVDRQALD